MVKYGIKIFARVKPTKKSPGLYEVSESEGLSSLSFVVPRSESSGYVNNKRETFSFKFNNVFEQDTKQDDIFNSVAKGVIDNCLEGYNGTIFAYGQTGSGKTFTITGGVEKYSDRGIIPRTLSYLFTQFQKCPGIIFTTHISYMEIYNNSGYDLLDPKHEASKLEDLPKVSLMEDGEGNIHMKNLSMHPATNEEESLNWLFIGDTNRMMAETPMNMASTRSHCIFTIHITSREPGSDTLKKAKLHLVDLAGSERIGKTGVSGTLLSEAKYINLSLHCLEQVIVALSEKSRTHIPYRNSMMTSVLRDSLGGNCMTTMIATCSVEKKNIDESISTCRFAQRVALVKNEATLNEELDPKLMVARLKAEVQQLKDELSLTSGEERTDELTEEQKEKCAKLVEQYVQDTSPESRLVVGGDMRLIQLAFHLLKTELLAAKESSVAVVDKTRNSTVESGSTGNSPREAPVVCDEELSKLRTLLKQRDDEISVLLKMLKQEKRRAADAEASLKRCGGQVIKPSSPILGRTSPLELSTPGGGGTSPGHWSETSSRGGRAGADGGEERKTRSPEPGQSREGGRGRQSTRESVEWVGSTRAELSQARQEAFDTFRRSIADMSSVDQHKKVLKAKYAEAKSLGERVNTSRVAINKIKAKIEKVRISRGVQELTSGPTGGAPDTREEELKTEIEKEKARFKNMYGQLKELKTEIEHIQHLHEKAKLKVQRDFEEWWDQQTGQGKDSRHQSARTAWRTPPASGLPQERPPSQQQHSRKSQRAIHVAANFSETKSPVPRDRPLAKERAVSERDTRVSSSQRQSGHSLAHGAEDVNRAHVHASDSITGSRQLDPLVKSSHKDGFLKHHRSLFTHSTTTNRSVGKADGSQSIPLTGDPRADADIIAFYKARQKLIQK